MKNWFNIGKAKQESPEEWLQSLASDLVDSNRHLDYIDGREKVAYNGLYYYVHFYFYQSIYVVLQYSTYTDRLLINIPYDNYTNPTLPITLSTPKGYLVQEINEELSKYSKYVDSTLNNLATMLQLWWKDGTGAPADLTPLTPYYKRITGEYKPANGIDKVQLSLDIDAGSDYVLTIEGYGKVNRPHISRRKPLQTIRLFFIKHLEAFVDSYGKQTTQADLISLRDTWNASVALRKELTMDDKITVTQQHPHTVDVTLPEDIHEVNIKGATTGVKVNIDTLTGEETTEATQPTVLSLDVIASELEDTRAYGTKYRRIDVNVRYVNPEMRNIGGLVFMKNLTEHNFAEQAIRRPFNLGWDSERKRTFLSVSGDSVEGAFEYEDELNEKMVADWAKSMLYNYILFGSFLNDH